LIKINFDWATRPAEGWHTKNHYGHKEEEVAPFYSNAIQVIRERKEHKQLPSATTVLCSTLYQVAIFLLWLEKIARMQRRNIKISFLLKAENLYLRLWM